MATGQDARGADLATGQEHLNAAAGQDGRGADPATGQDKLDVAAGDDARGADPWTVNSLWEPGRFVMVQYARAMGSAAVSQASKAEAKAAIGLADFATHHGDL